MSKDPEFQPILLSFNNVSLQLFITRTVALLQSLFFTFGLLLATLSF